MRYLGWLAAVLLAGSMLLPMASSAQTSTGAQNPAPLTYTQPLTPQAIREVQQRLRQIGLYSGTPDGIWGPDSQAALERFQQSRGLQVTGQMNQATAATLGLNPPELLALGQGQAPSASPTAQQQGAATGEPLNPEVVRTIQGKLRQLGFYSGEADGVWGPNTQTAIARFQQSRGLQATGQLNPNTITAMGLDPNNLAAQTRATPPAGVSGSSSPRR
jgi:peptidoglycan hydrolase-like protein with peptidoglycan-binding domain